MQSIHSTSLESVETDDPSILFHKFDGFFLYTFFYSWAEEDLSSTFECDKNSTKRDLDWFEEVWKRNLVGTNQTQVIAKLFTFPFYLPLFFQRFPKAKIIYLVRDPIETVPSCLSLLSNVMEKRYKISKLDPKAKQLFYDRIYSALLKVNLKLLHSYISGDIPEKKVLLIKFPTMMANFQESMNRLFGFLEISKSHSLDTAIKATSKSQKKYNSLHKYQLEQFGISEGQIRRDYSEFYETFITS